MSKKGRREEEEYLRSEFSLLIASINGNHARKNSSEIFFGNKVVCPEWIHKHLTAAKKEI